MLPRLWNFIRNSKNREIVSWLGGGAAVIVAGLWAVFTYFASPSDKRPAASTTITQSGPGIASGRDTVVNAPVNIGVDEKQVGQRIVDAQKPLADQLEKLAAQVAREKGVEIAPLRAILVRLGEAGVRDEDVPKRLDEKAMSLHARDGGPVQWWGDRAARRGSLHRTQTPSDVPTNASCLSADAL